MKLNDIQTYYKEGLLRKNFKDTKSLKSLKNSLINLHLSDSPGKENFFWESKYKNTLDLRPNAFEFDLSAIDILFDNDIPDLLSKIVGEDITLSHIQIRKSSAGPGYMPWHRDMYFIDDRIVGACPPAHKIIFYPKIPESTDEPKLSLLKGSHNCLFQKQRSSEFLLPGCSVYDREIFHLFHVENYSPSENEFIIFNTSMLHNTLPTTDPVGSIRIIYSFVKKFQFENIFSHKEGHTMLNELYEKGKSQKQ